MAGDDEILRIAAQFDVGSITAGMDEAAASVQTGTARMVASFKASGLSSQEMASALKNLGYSAAEVSAALGPMAAETTAVAAAEEVATTTTAGLSNAMATLAGRVLGAEAGLGMLGGGFGRVGAAAGAATPILIAAIPIALIIGAIKLYEDFRESVISLTEAQTASSRVLDEGNNKLLTQKEEIAEISGGPMAKYAAQLHDIGDMLPALSSGLSVFNKELQDNDHWWLVAGRDINYAFEALRGYLTEGLGGAVTNLSAATASVFDPKDVELFTAQVEKSIHGNQDLAGAIAKVKDELNAVNKLWHDGETLSAQLTNKNSLKELEEYYDRLIQRQQDYQNQTTKLQAEESRAAEESIERHERENESYLRSKLAADKQEFDEARRVQEQIERNDEAVARHYAEILKKDTEDFRQSVVEKTRLQEQFGKDQLEQIKAAAEAQSRSVQAHSFAGAADPALIQIADRALDEQAFKIMDLIALEEKLRATLIQTGAAESDPKIQESLGRQQQLVQQLAIAMQKYDAAVQKASDDQSRKFIQSFDAITGKVNSSILSWVNGTESFGKAMEKVWIGLADTAIESLLKIAEQELIGMLLHKTIADTQKLDDAKTAAAGAYAATSSIPIVGPVLAPAAAAAAFAAVLAFEKGGIMPNSEGLALLHPREMVLPSHISESVQRMASGGGGGGARGGGAIHIHQVISGNPSASDMANMEKATISAVRRARRRGSF